MMRSRRFVVALAFAAGGLAGALIAAEWLAANADVAATTVRPVWTEVQWPFPIDQWGKGKAFRCRAADCGTEVKLYLRAKIGFCNCTTGVADDEELERLSDLDLIGNKFAARNGGTPVAVAWMNGRSRSYTLVGSNLRHQSAILVAFNDRCDAIVTTVVLGHNRPAEIEPRVIAFLNSKTVLNWAEAILGL
jgi:hypothetical protein